MEQNANNDGYGRFNSKCVMEKCAANKYENEKLHTHTKYLFDLIIGYLVGTSMTLFALTAFDISVATAFLVNIVRRRLNSSVPASRLLLSFRNFATRRSEFSSYKGAEEKAEKLVTRRNDGGFRDEGEMSET